MLERKNSGLSASRAKWGLAPWRFGMALLLGTIVFCHGHSPQLFADAAAAMPAAAGAVTPALPPPTREQIDDARNLSRTFAQVAEQVSPSVVSIRVSKKSEAARPWKFRFRENLPKSFRDFPFFFDWPFGNRGKDKDRDEDKDFGESPPDEDRSPLIEGAGSGVVIDEKGFILTNSHVIKDVRRIKVQFQDGQEMDAKVVGRDGRADLAVLKVEPKDYRLRSVRFGDSDKLMVGEWVIAIGNPFGLSHTVTVGVISAKGRSGVVDTHGGYQDFLQTDASINPGNSGGPLVNLNGELIGINTAIYGPGGNIGIGFAVPSTMARPIAQELMAHGKVKRPYLGITMQEMSQDMAKALGAPGKGVLVQGLSKGAPAEKTGVRRGDVILSVDGKPVKDGHEVQRQVLSHRIGDNIALELWRDGKRVTLQMKAAELPDDDEHASGDPGDDKSKLGLKLQTLTPRLAERFGVEARSGAVITSVRPASPAAEARLERGDVILEVDRRPVQTAEQAMQALAGERKEGHVLLVQRGANTLFLLLKP
jgi:serine protease Do